MKLRRKFIHILTLILFFITLINPIISINAEIKQGKTENLIVIFNKNNIDMNVENLIKNSGGKIVKEIPQIGCLEIEGDSELISYLQNQDTVKSVYLNNTIKSKYSKNDIINSNYLEQKKNFDENKSSFDNLYEKYEWDIKKVTNNGESFKLESGNHNTIIGIVDSGVDTKHSDLKNNFLGGKNLVPKYFKCDNTETGTINDIEDRFGHGTNIAGQIAANGKTKGVAPNIGFKAYRIFNKNGETTASICADAIITAVDDRVDVINLSFESYYLIGQCTYTDSETKKVYNIEDDRKDYIILSRAIKYAKDHNVIIVTCAGNKAIDCSDNKMLTNYFNNLYKNDGYNYKGLIYETPGSFDGVVTVSATNSNDTLASYSNYGRDFIDVSAPGGDRDNKESNSNLCLTTSIGNEYVFTAGTSLSSAKVSAAIALIKCKNKNLSSNDILNKLYNSADRVYIDESSNYYGAGILNVYNALKE